MSIHKTVVLWFIVGCAASGDGLAHHVINFFPALRREAYKHLSAFRCITNVFRGKSLELVIRQQHHEDVLTHDHTGGRIVSKLGIKTEAELRKELDRLLDVVNEHRHIGSTR